MATVSRRHSQHKIRNTLVTATITFDDAATKWVDLGDPTGGPDGTTHLTPPTDPRSGLPNWVPLGEVVEDWSDCDLDSLEFTVEKFHDGGSPARDIQILVGDADGTPWKVATARAAVPAPAKLNADAKARKLSDVASISCRYAGGQTVSRPTRANSLTLEESGHSESNSGTAPSHTLAGAPSEGELILWHLHCRSNDLTEIGAPSGFATDGPGVSAVSGYDMTYECFYKVAGASEGTAYTGSMTNSSHWAVGMEVISSTEGWTEGTTLDDSTVQTNTYTSTTTTMSTSSSGTLAGTEGWAVIGATSRTGGETHSAWTTDFTEDWDDSTGAGGGAISYAVAYDIRTVTTAYTATVDKSNATQGVIATGAFIEDASSGLEITPAAVTVNATAGTVTVDMDLTPAAVTVTATPGTVTVDMDLTPAAVTVTVTPGTVTVDMDLTPAAVTVTVTPGTVTVDMAVTLTGPTVTATAGALSLAVDLTPAAVTVTVTPGTVQLDMAVTLTGPTVTATAGTLTVSLDTGQDITPAAVTVTATPGALSLAVDLTPAAVTVNVTAGTLTLGGDVTLTGPTVTATAGTVSVDMSLTPAAVTVTVTPGTVTVDMAVTLTGPTVTATAGTVIVAGAGLSITPENVTVTATGGALVVSRTLRPETFGYRGAHAVYREAARRPRVEAQHAPAACPNDGTPLQRQGNVWRCPYDGWEWPADREYV